MIYQDLRLDEERALYGVKDAIIKKCSFDGPLDGESAIKECKNIEVDECYFNLRYPFWHVDKAVIKNSEMTENCRAALWYDDDITVDNCKMNGIKAFRECKNIKIYNSEIVSPEFIWRCKNVDIKNTTLESEYPMFECVDVVIDDLKMKGKYSFQYVKNMTITNSVLDTKDAFWHAENVTVTDSVVKGEYLGWYSKNLKFVRCHIIGTQPLCYCENLVIEDCVMEDTDLSFERSEVNAKINGRIEGVKNPKSGKIVVDEIGELLFEKDIVEASNTKIICDKILNRIEK